MADEASINPHEAFVQETASLGPIRCGRIRVGDAMRMAKAVGNDATPDLIVRALLREIGNKADGARLTAEETAALSPSEVEEFAEQVLATHPHYYLERKKEMGPEGTKIIPGEFTDPFLERADDESAIQFLARALDHRANRIGGILAASANSAVGLSALMGLTTGAAMAASFKNSANLARSAIMPRLGASGRAAAQANSANVSPISDTVASLADLPRDADVALTVLNRQIEEFTKDLGENDRVELVSSSAPGGISFFIQERVAVSAEMISLKGFGPDARPIEIVQHYTQLNIALIAVPKSAEERHFGFIHPNDDF